MRLLIVTQSIDINNPLMGFFTRWVEEFSKYFEKVIVICLERGEYQLPKNVKVLSLGKEKHIGNSRKWHIIRRLEYLYYFYKYIFKERNNYDKVFVHMNQEYVILGGLFWKFFKKKIFLWRNHPFGNFLTDLAVFLSSKVFCTSLNSYTAKFKKTVIMPVGVDTEIFKRDKNISAIENSILYLGRISPIKNIDVLIEAVKILDREGIDFILNIVGGAKEKDKEYFEKIKKLSKDLEDKGKIKFLGEIPNYKTPEIYNQHEVFVNLTPSGSLDKAIFEAMSCGCIVLCSNNYFLNSPIRNFIFKEKDVKDLSLKLKTALNLSYVEKEKIFKDSEEFVFKKHSLKRLMQELKVLI